MGLLDERLVIDGYKLDADIAGRLTGAILVRTMEGASSLELTLDDNDLVLLKSGVLTNPARINSRQRKLANFDQAAWARFGTMRLVLDGRFFRLAGVQGNYDEKPYSITLTFEDEIAALMRAVNEALSFPRNLPRIEADGTRRGTTRSDFLGLMVAKAQVKSKIVINYWSPEGGQKRRIKTPDAVTTGNRKKGLSNRTLYIKGTRATATQRRNITIALTEADEQKASELATLSMLCAGIGESSFIAQMNSKGSGYGGVFQGDVAAKYHYFTINQTKEQAHYFLVGGKGFQQGGAIKLATSSPDLTPGSIATKVEASGEAPSFYDAYLDEAKAILDAWGGVSIDSTVVRERYNFRAGGKDKTTGKRENYWDGSGRLGDDVRWRRFAEENVLWFVDDEWLFGRQPVFEFTLGDLGVFGLNFTVDVGIPVAEIQVRALTARWAGPAGCVVVTEDVGALTANWLMWEHRQDLLSETGGLCDSEFTLRRPAPDLAEPAPSTRTVTVGPADAPGDLAYPLAEKGKLIGTPGVGTHAWGQNWQSSNAVDIGVPEGTDVFAVEDGVISPPSSAYSGFGDTGQGGRFAGKRLHLKAAGSNRAWYYAHLSSFASGIEPGAHVSKGDVIGKSGSANGVAHLHIAVGPGRNWDPKKLLGL